MRLVPGRSGESEVAMPGVVAAQRVRRTGGAKATSSNGSGPAGTDGFSRPGGPPAKGSLEELMNNHADVLAVAPNNTVLLQIAGPRGRHSPGNEEFDDFVTQLLRSLRKYEGRSRSPA